jgi:hypothetical protein
LQAFAEEHKLGTSHFTAIGAFKHAVVGFFDRTKMDYIKIPIKEQVEVLSVRKDTKSMPMLCSASLMRALSEGISSRRMFGPRWK